MAVEAALNSVGLTWTTGLIAVLNILVGSLFVAIVKSRPALKKIAADREANLLHERAAEMESMRERLRALEAKLELKDRLHEAERALDRHRYNNLSQSFDALLMLLKQNPEKVDEAIVIVEKMRADQLKREALEKGAVFSAGIETTTTTTVTK
jgi:Cft2 family RNA processing exonuclease